MEFIRSIYRQAENAWVASGILSQRSPIPTRERAAYLTNAVGLAFIAGFSFTFAITSSILSFKVLAIIIGGVSLGGSLASFQAPFSQVSQALAHSDAYNRRFNHVIIRDLSEEQ